MGLARLELVRWEDMLMPQEQASGQLSLYAAAPVSPPSLARAAAPYGMMQRATRTARPMWRGFLDIYAVQMPSSTVVGHRLGRSTLGLIHANPRALPYLCCLQLAWLRRLTQRHALPLQANLTAIEGEARPWVQETFDPEQSRKR